jgi:sugar phosphate permease
VRPFLHVTLPLAALNVINQASRTIMAVIGPVLAVEFAFSASELGFLAACMFIAYAAVQLPSGLALDLLGPRRVQATLSLVAAAGFAVFALSDGLLGFSVARIVLGVGVAAGLMSIIKANTQWFAPAQVAKVTGIAVALGGLGSILTTTPVQMALPAFGWRGVMWLLCALSVAVSVWIFLSVRDKPASGPPAEFKAEVRVTASILASRTFWRYGPPVSMLAVLNFAYLGLWAGPWLRDVAGYEGVARANTLLVYALGSMAGVTVAGAAMSWAQARGYPGMRLVLAFNAALVLVQVALALQPGGAAVPVLWVLFAFCTATSTTGYIVVGQMFPRDQMARVSTANNTLTLVGAFLLQTAIGWLLDLWPRTPAGGWDPRGYSAALAGSAAIQVLLAIPLFTGGALWRARS